MIPRSFSEIYEYITSIEKIYSQCNHDFKHTDMISSEGRFGGDCMRILKCSKCGMEINEKDL